MGEPTRSGRSEHSSLDQNLRRERGQELEDTRICEKKYKNKVIATKRGRRGRAGRRAAQQHASNDHDQARRRELIITTHSVRTMDWDGKNAVGRAAEVLGMYQEMGCDTVGLKETRRSNQSALLQIVHVVYCSGEFRGDWGGKKSQGGVGLVVRKSISHAEVRSTELISDKLLKVTLELCRRARAVTFVVGYSQQTLKLSGKITLSGQPWTGS